MDPAAPPSARLALSDPRNALAVPLRAVVGRVDGPSP